MMKMTWIMISTITLNKMAMLPLIGIGYWVVLVVVVVVVYLLLEVHSTKSRK